MESRSAVLSMKGGGIYESGIINAYQTGNCGFLPGGFAHLPVSPRRVPPSFWEWIPTDVPGIWLEKDRRYSIAFNRCRNFSYPLSSLR